MQFMYVLVIFCYNFDTSTGYDTDNDGRFGKAGVQDDKIQTGKRKISQNSCGGPDIVGSAGGRLAGGKMVYQA